MSSTDPFAAIFASAWPDGEPYQGLSGAELSAMVDRELARVDAMLFTATAREDLSDIGLWQRLQDVALAGQLRSIARTVAKASVAQREFVADEVALSINAGWITGENLVGLAVRSSELPGLLESMETGDLTSRHLRMIIELLHEVELTLEQRRAIVLVLLARFTGQTPGELRTILRKLIIKVDATAARRRNESASRGRQVNTYPTTNGQGCLGAIGPMEQIAQIRAALNTAMANEQRPEGDTRGHDEREFDLLVELICGRTERGHWQVQVIVPYSTATGGELELAEIPGFGAVLPSTARDLIDLVGSLSAVGVDASTGDVLGISDTINAPKPDRPKQAATAGPTPTSDQSSDAGWLHKALLQLITKPLHQDPQPTGYRVSRRLERLVEARDRTCTFPGCHLPAERTDKDHRLPYPRGQTTAANIHCLCRRHHRAKQASFTVRVSDDGDTEWVSRGGRVFTRRRQPY